MDWNTIASLFDKAISGVTSLFSWLGKGTLDKTEIEKAKLELKTVITQLEFSKAQMTVWLMQGGKIWHTPLVLLAGIAAIGVPINNILASVYFSWAKPIDLVSWNYAMILAIFISLASGSFDVLLKLAQIFIEKLSKSKNGKENKDE